MRTYLILALLVLTAFCRVQAQRACATFEYDQLRAAQDPSHKILAGKAEQFIRMQQSTPSSSARLTGQVIRIPVVVHVLYHSPDQDVSDEKVYGQLSVLNACFRRKNDDTANTPAVFKGLAADCEIEFALATSDPRRRSTSGIIHKYTPINEWEADDRMKYSAEMGDDAWDAASYLNIWVCNVRRVAGYSSVPGSEAKKDGIVIDYSVFGPNVYSGYEKGRTAVHEIGHWLGLKHIWGDNYCGDDGVDDTPKQGNFTSGCPSGTRVSCSNAPSGDMYMNYMDYTSDNCTNLFTEGQKNRMRAGFAAGGPRASILASTGLNLPWIVEAPLPEDSPTWLHYQVYPNPVTNELTLDVAYDTRWIGKTLLLTNANGQAIMQIPITTKIQKINTSKLVPGVYFLSARKEDGSFIKQKFIKI